MNNAAKRKKPVRLTRSDWCLIYGALVYYREVARIGDNTLFAKLGTNCEKAFTRGVISRGKSPNCAKRELHIE